MVIAQNLAHRYGRHVVFTELSFTAGQGEVIAITGRNGSGKSTLVKILAGLLRPTGGHVRWTATDSEAVPVIGLVAPYVNLYEDMTLRENLRFIGQLRGMHPTESRFVGIEKEVGLSGAENKVLRTYSTGMLQRARFAAALVHTPSVLLLDEPTLGLDRFGYGLCEHVVDNLKRAGGTVIIASNARRDVGLAGECLCVEDFAPGVRDRT